MRLFIVALALLISTNALAAPITGVRSFSKIIDVTPVISAAAYDANDVVGSVNTLTGAVLGGAYNTYGTATLGSLTVLDKAKQKSQLDVCFYSASPTISANGAAYDLTDAESLKTLGCVGVAAADYIDSASNSVATLRGLSLLLHAASGTSVYMAVITRGTPTYASTSDLVLRVGLYQE